MHAYDESYLNDAMDNLGCMFDYAVVDCGFEIDEFFGWFTTSGVAVGFENGNPRYVAGMSGVELALEVYHRTFQEHLNVPSTQALEKSPEYWVGWVLAYYQWYRAVRFSDMAKGGLLPSIVLQNYVLHEADVSKFVNWADGLLETQDSKNNALAAMRRLRGLTQQQLADASGVSLRMIQLYEQGRNNLSKASFETVISLARIVGCKAEDLL